MKKQIFTFVCLLFISMSIFAQTPQAINYQGVARDNGGNVLASQAVSLKLSILSGSASGTVVYSETHSKTTDAFGLFALQIGQGSVVSGTFSTISWGTNTYYLKVEIDPAGGNSYQLVGTNQFVSVPYALYSGGAANAWGLTGNTGTVDGTNFIGTTDNKPLNFKVNNQKSGRIDTVGTAFFGYKAGKSNTSTTNTGFGYKALSANTTGFQNTAVGQSALASNISSAYNTATGYHALYANTEGNYNTAYGTDALAGNRSGFSNTAIGYQALYNQSYHSSGGWAAENVAIGYYSLVSNQPTSTSNGIQNTAVGSISLAGNTTGYGNVALGHSALDNNMEGYNNTAIGFNADVSTFALSNATAIGANAVVSSSNSLVLGNNASVGIGISTPGDVNGAILDVVGRISFRTNSNDLTKLLIFEEDITSHRIYSDATIGVPYDIILGTYPYGHSDQLVLKQTNGYVGIGTTNPGAKLEVAGQIKITGGTPGTGKVLTSNSSGLATWETPTNAWGLTGNSGTVDGTNFIGTTDNKPLNFKVNNQKSGRIDTVGTAFFGYKAGKSNTSTTNTGFGYKALSANTTGFQNTAVGQSALASNISSAYNTATGYHALYANTEGNYNTAYGTDALAGNRSGFSNTAIGYQALYNQSYHSSGGWAAENVAIGYYSLVSNQPTSTSNGIQNTAVGSISLAGNTTGYGNVALGHSALDNNMEGYNNTAIGFNADVSTFALSNATAIGANAVVSSSNSMVLGSGAKVGIGTSSPVALLHLKNGHIKSEQATAPTIAVTTANGITAAAITTNSSDTKGNLTTTGTNSGTAYTALTITFNTAYNIAPTVTITAANTSASQCIWYVTSTTTSFVLYFKGAYATPSFNFMVIE